MRTNKSSVTVFIQCSRNKVFSTQLTDLCWQLSVVRAWSEMVVLRCCSKWREKYVQCVSRIVQSFAEQPVVGLVQQLLKVSEIKPAVATTDSRTNGWQCSMFPPVGRGIRSRCVSIVTYYSTV